jgi:hypothetical protein
MLAEAFKIPAIFCMFFGCIFLSRAQESGESVTLIWGSQELLSSSEILPTITGHDSSGFYMLSYDHRWAIEHYDAELKHTRKEYIDLLVRGRTREVEGLIHFHDILYLFTSEQRFSYMILYVETIDKKTLKQSGDERIFTEIHNMSGWMADFGFRLSKKENKLLVYSKIVAFWQKYQMIDWGVYGPGLKEEWHSRDEIKYTRVPKDEYDFVVDEEGNGFMINLYFDPKWFEQFMPQKNIYQILTRTDNGKTYNEYYADFEGRYIRAIGIEPGKNNTLGCSGFYSPAYYRYKIDGVFFFNIDLTAGQIKDRKFHEFDKFFLAEAMNLKQNNNYEELFSFNLDYFVARKNGNYLLAAQQMFEQNFDTYNNIILVCLDPEGNILWDRTIFKKQNHDLNEKFNYSSYYILAPYDWNKVEIIYNEHLKNLDRQDGDRYVNFGYAVKAYLNLVEIGEHGELSEVPLYLKTKNRMLTPLPVLGYDMKNHELVIPAMRYRKYKFLKLVFPDSEK